MNPGEVWELPDGTRNLVLSVAAYNSPEAGLGRVISAVMTDPPQTFAPFAVATPHGTVRADRLLSHPRGWLVAPVARIPEEAYAEVRRHLGFLLGLG